jgi:hypothetical protein
MTTLIQPPPMDPWNKGVRAVDVPIVPGSTNPLERDLEEYFYEESYLP